MKVKKHQVLFFISLDHIYLYHKRISQSKLKSDVRIAHISTEMFYFSFQITNIKSAAAFIYFFLHDFFRVVS